MDSFLEVVEKVGFPIAGALIQGSLSLLFLNLF